MPAELTEMRIKEKGDGKREKEKGKRNDQTVSEDKCLGGAEGLITPRIRTRKRKSINSAPCERSETSFALCDEVPGWYMCGPDVEPGFWSPAHVLWPVPKSFAGHQPPLRGAFLEPQGLRGRGLPKIEPFGVKRLYQGTRRFLSCSYRRMPLTAICLYLDMDLTLSHLVP